MLDLDALHD
jgi:hypothetical protein